MCVWFVRVYVPLSIPLFWEQQTSRHSNGQRMTDQSLTAHFYGIAESVPENVLVPVGKSEAYKALREQELMCYHHLVRVLHMHTAELNRSQSRILEDLRDMFEISQERGDIEVTMALADPLVDSIRASGVARNRSLHRDGSEDLVARHIAAALQHPTVEFSEDDKRQEVVIAETARGSGQQSAARSTPNGFFSPVPLGGAAAAKKPGGKTGPSSTSAVVLLAKDTAALSASSAELAKKYVRSSLEARLSLKQDLLVKLGDAESLLQRYNEQVANGDVAADLMTGRATPRMA